MPCCRVFKVRHFPGARKKVVVSDGRWEIVAKIITSLLSESSVQDYKLHPVDDGHNLDCSVERPQELRAVGRGWSEYPPASLSSLCFKLSAENRLLDRYTLLQNLLSEFCIAFIVNLLFQLETDAEIHIRPRPQGMQFTMARRAYFKLTPIIKFSTVLYAYVENTTRQAYGSPCTPWQMGCA